MKAREEGWWLVLGLAGAGEEANELMALKRVRVTGSTEHRLSFEVPELALSHHILKTLIWTVLSYHDLVLSYHDVGPSHSIRVLTFFPPSPSCSTPRCLSGVATTS